MQVTCPSRTGARRTEASRECLTFSNPSDLIIRLMREPVVVIELLEPRRLLSAVTATSGAAAGPSASLKVTLGAPPRGTESAIFTVTYRDADGVNPTSFDNRDLRISGPNRFARYARAIGSSSNVTGTQRVVRYEIAPPGGVWDIGDNGTYTVRLHGGEVLDFADNASPSQQLGTFTVNIPKRQFPTPVRKHHAAAAAADVIEPLRDVLSL